MFAPGRVDEQIRKLKQQIADTEAQLSTLHQQLEKAEARSRTAQDLEIAYQGGVPHAWQQEAYEVFSHLFPTAFEAPSASGSAASPAPDAGRRWPLKADEYRRYGRQLIMPEVGLRGQLRLKQAKVLVVGAGGLGCPAAAYLAGAGVGSLGIVDGDVVEESNLHRQITHSTSKLGKTKVESAVAFCKDLNPNVRYRSHEHMLSSPDALDLFRQYHVILDCTDHPTSRYLVSDACVLTGRPLVSASALRTEGQLIVLNNPPKPPGDTSGSPCYRCVWPSPPPPDTLLSCGEGGILGPVVGVMGVMQALEAIKIITAEPDSSSLDAGMNNNGGSTSSPSSSTTSPSPAGSPSLLMFSAFHPQPFRSVRIRARRKDCAACSPVATVNEDSLSTGSLDYVAFCGVAHPFNVLDDHERVDAVDVARHLPDPTQGISVLDVRPKPEFDMCSIDGSVNVPWTDLTAALKAVDHAAPRPSWLDSKNLVVVCRLGNDSQKAVRLIKGAGLARGNVVDMKDGFRAWRQKVDTSWPDY